MSVLQSPAIAKNASYRPCHSPSLGALTSEASAVSYVVLMWGRGEGGLNFRERRFVCCSFCSPSHPFQPNHTCHLGLRTLLPLLPQPRLCAFASSLLKFGKKAPQIPKPLQGPREGEGTERGLPRSAD